MNTSTDPGQHKSIRDAFDLNGRRAVVTGASRGMGRAIAIAYARRGADVLAVARSADALRQTRTLAGDAAGRFAIHEADLRLPSAIDSTVKRARDELGGIDVLVNNAADSHASSIEETEVETWQRVVELNLSSCWRLCRAASSTLRDGGGGSVINVASILGLVGSRDESAYVAAKHGLVGLTRALALEWARPGVRVNAIAPGYVETAMTSEYLADDAFGAWVRRSTPQGRWAHPEEVTGAAIFLAARASSYVTGQILVVDGGWTAQ
jgi:NAD(P)-dependent dehydrogenase (short-subunit alcohol dehydrogenase family)